MIYHSFTTTMFNILIARPEYHKTIDYLSALKIQISLVISNYTMSIGFELLPNGPIFEWLRTDKDNRYLAFPAHTKELLIRIVRTSP